MELEGIKIEFGPGDPGYDAGYAAGLEAAAEVVDKFAESPNYMPLPEIAARIRALAEEGEDE